MEKAKIRPLATPKPLNRSSQKLGRRDYVLDGTRHAKFFSDPFRSFCSPNTWFCRAFGVTSFLFVFWGFFNQATAYTPKRIVTQSTSEYVVPGKEVPFGGFLWLYLIFRPSNFRKTAILGNRFWLDWFFLQPNTALTWGCSIINYP